MAANISPIFTITPKQGWGTVSTANTAKDGTGTVVTVFTAGDNGARVDRIRAQPGGTNVASVLRVFMNNGSDPTTAANNTYLEQVSLPAITNSEAAAVQFVDVPGGPWVLPAGYKLNITIGTTVATNWAVTASGGDF